jgi:hypothetical protein
VISDKVNDLFHAQLRDWELAAKNYGQLGKVLTRSIGFAGFDILVQFNPERIRSSAAKVDAKSIGDRPCFLCAQNRPPEQRGVPFSGEMTVLVNPYPIFDRHITITSEFHIPQRIRNSFSEMLELAKALPEYVIFYNGPQCGASAPDHLHFQAGNRGFMPVEKDFSGGRLAQMISSKAGIGIWKWNGYLRTLLTLTGSDPVTLSSLLISILDNFSGFKPNLPEPMLNILAYFDSGSWIIHIFPRKVHRPKQFFAEGNDQILLSPAAVDLGGVLITPREEDYKKITRTDVVDIFHQVCLDENDMSGLINGLV